MENHARAVWFISQRAVEIRPVPVLPPADGEVLVHTRFSGISPGTEMLAYRGDLEPDLAQDETIGALSGTFRYPFRYGYSTVGVVEESRSDIPVGTQVFAFHPHQERLTVSSRDVVPIDGLPAREATLFPLVETAFQITLDAGLTPGQRAVVMGLGPVGSLTAVLLARSGVRVVGVDPLPWRRTALSRSGGPDLAVVEPDSLDSIKENGEGPIPLVIEASGNPQAVRMGLGLLSHEGTLLVASWFGTREVSLPLGKEFHRRRLTIRSTQVSTIPGWLQGKWDKEQRKEAVVELLGDLSLSAFTTHTFPFEEAAEAYAAIDQARAGLIHSALAYD